MRAITVAVAHRAAVEIGDLQVVAPGTLANLVE
jgi:hypothetical protein